MKCSLGISSFLQEISSLSHSTVFLYLFALITEEGFLISLLFFGTPHSNWYIFPFILFFLLLFFSQLFVRPPQTAILLFCISFSWGWSWFLSPVQCHEPPSIVHQALCLADLIPWIYLSLPLYNCRIWFRSYLNSLVLFHTFFNLSDLNSWSEPQSAPIHAFTDYIELLYLWLQKI